MSIVFITRIEIASFKIFDLGVKRFWNKSSNLYLLIYNQFMPISKVFKEGSENFFSGELVKNN